MLLLAYDRAYSKPPHDGQGYEEEEAAAAEGQEESGAAKDTADTYSDGEEKKETEQQPLSKKKLKKLQRLSVAELKQLVKKPETVEVRLFISSAKFENGWFIHPVI